MLDSINPNEKLRRVQGEMPFLKFVLLLFIFSPSILFANNNYKKILDSELKLLVNNGSVLVANEQKILYRYPHGNNFKFIPASVIKLATALASIHFLGLDFKFETDFFLNKKNILVIRGAGDPFLVSEMWRKIAKNLSQLPALPKKVKKLSFDNSLFSKKIVIPGIKNSINPYDAKNGALVVNFNTISLKVAANGFILSGEKQTPLTPLARRLGRKLSIGSHRINVPDGSEIQYAGEVIRAIFRKEGISFDSSKVNLQSVVSEDIHLYTYENKMSILEIIAGMMLYSNNFTANQLFLRIGIKRYGAPASLEKGKKAVQEYLEKELKIPIDQFDVVEGSGISRKNRLTPKVVLSLLNAFSKERYLLNNEKGIFLKTGTLRGVYTMAGYLSEEIYFVILLNQKKNNRDKILELLLSKDFTE